MTNKPNQQPPKPSPIPTEPGNKPRPPVKEDNVPDQIGDNPKDTPPPKRVG
jgi:hypothetical protein